MLWVRMRIRREASNFIIAVGSVVRTSDEWELYVGRNISMGAGDVVPRTLMSSGVMLNGTIVRR